MINSNLTIYLASKSPRRKKLLRQLNLNFKTITVHADESIKNSERPADIVRRLSLNKLKEAEKKIKKGIIITADTIVVLEGKVLGKPSGPSSAERMLKMLSGKTHTVYTGFAIYNSVKNKTVLDYEKTAVTFRRLNSKEIKDYVATGSPLDKAGSYGIQDDFGAVFVSKINGCYYNVVGLPLTKLYKALLGII